MKLALPFAAFAGLLGALPPLAQAQLAYEMNGFSQCEPVRPAELGASILAAGVEAQLRLDAPLAFRAGLHCALDARPDERGRSVYSYTFHVAIVEARQFEGRQFEATLGEATLWGSNTDEGLKLALPGAVRAAIADFRKRQAARSTPAS